MLKKLVLLFCVVFLLPMMALGQNFDMRAFKNTSASKQQLMAMQYENENSYEADSVRFDYEKSPGLAFLMSAVVPGAGELYTGKWGRAIGFIGMEALFWGMHFSKKNQGQDIEEEYKEYADEHWNLEEWASTYSDWNTGSNSPSSHGIHVIIKTYENGEYVWDGNESDIFEIKTGSDFADLRDSIAVMEGDAIIEPIKNRDYYENIGKYNQFSYGWEDFETDSTVSDIRDHYLTRREDSNNALKMASQFGTAVIINHVVSAIHAQIMAKTYKAEEKDLTWNLSLMTDVRRKYLVNGLNLSLRF